MPQNLKPKFLFFIFSFIFAALLWRSPNEAVICGVLYSALIGAMLPEDTRPRDLFPLVMLFLFLMVLTQMPPKLFTASINYTVRSLIAFRALLLALSLIQNAKGKTERREITWVAGLTLTLASSALLVYSTFRPVSESALLIDHFLLIAPLMILSSLFTPLMIPGVLLGITAFVPSLQIGSVLIFSLMVIVHSIYPLKLRRR